MPKLMHPPTRAKLVPDAPLISRIEGITSSPIQTWCCPCRKDCPAKVLYARCVHPVDSVPAFCFMPHMSSDLDNGLYMALVKGAEDFNIFNKVPQRVLDEMAEVWQARVDDNIVELDRQQIRNWLKHGLREAVLSAPR
jgi:hypothetical protein